MTHDQRISEIKERLWSVRKIAPLTGKEALESFMVFSASAPLDITYLLERLGSAETALKAYEQFSLRFRTEGGLATNDSREELYDSGLFNPATEHFEKYKENTE